MEKQNGTRRDDQVARVLLIPIQAVDAFLALSLGFVFGWVTYTQAKRLQHSSRALSSTSIKGGCVCFFSFFFCLFGRIFLWHFKGGRQQGWIRRKISAPSQSCNVTELQIFCNSASVKFSLICTFYHPALIRDWGGARSPFKIFFNVKMFLLMYFYVLALNDFHVGSFFILTEEPKKPFLKTSSNSFKPRD